MAAEMSPPLSDTSNTGQPPGKPKRRRITQACDYCHRRSIRCQITVEGAPCKNCQDFGQPCTYLRKPRRRGVQPRSENVANNGIARATHTHPIQTSSTPPSQRSGPTSLSADILPLSLPPEDDGTPQQSGLASLPWEAPFIANQATIVDLVDIYFEIVYPIFPFFHQPSFTRSISRAEYMTDKTLFATTMAICALTSSRVRDGSVTNPRWHLSSLRSTDPDAFYLEAQRQLVGETSGHDINVIRAYAVLAIAAIQNGRIRDMHRLIGTYHTLLAMDGLHDESNWPRDIGVIEREERRRLFWSIYTLDIYSAVVWGGVIRSREQQSNVSYPVEVDDEFIGDDHGILHPVEPVNPPQSTGGLATASTVRSDSWLSGWNFITDLYRVLEHALARFRGHRSRARQGSFPAAIFDDQSTVTETSVRDSMLLMYLNLPNCFKETPQMTYNARKDRFGFQAANITATVQLVRIVLFAAGGASIDERCQIANEVVAAFAAIPISYLLAISTPLLHHLGGIGTILGSVFEEPLSEADYDRVRSIMLSMASLLENLETIHPSSSASQQLKARVMRIDEHMARQRQATLPIMVPATPATTAAATVSPIGTRDPSGLHNTSESYEGLESQLGGWPQLSPGWLGELSWNFDLS